MTAIVTFTGFTEDYNCSNGMEQLDENVLSRLDGKGAEVFIPRQWDEDTRGLASLLDRRGFTEVILVGYSHGAGYACIKMAQHLGKRGVRVPLMFLCDPVYRPLWLPRWTVANVFSFRALIPRSAYIKVPAVVEEVLVVRQTNNVPCGHPLKLHPSTTLSHHRVLTGYTHSTIDSAPEWHATVKLRLANYLLAKNRQGC